jgi:hypothetical protein
MTLNLFIIKVYVIALGWFHNSFVFGKYYRKYRFGRFVS